MVKVAITGGIGSGKSYVCRLLEKRGLRIYDCDSAAKRIMASCGAIQSELKKTVGENVFVDGKLVKSVLADYLLKSDDNAKRINNIVHPAVAEDFVGSGYEWMECAILFSSGFDRLVDKVVCVTAPVNVRIERIMNRDGISRQNALDWIAKQMPQDEIVALSDFEIKNDGHGNLESQIDNILALLHV